MPFLVWDSPSGRVVREIDKAILIVGRDSVADVQVAERSVSRRHALLERDGDVVRVTDLGSSSGTKINGATLARDMPATLEVGDFLHLGRVILSFHAHPPPATKQETADALQKKAASPPKRAKARPAPAAAKPFPWKWVALGLAFVLVGVTGAVVALALGGGKPEQADSPVATQPPAPAPEPEPPPPQAQPQPEPVPEAVGPELAPRNLLPPATYASIDACPDLLTVDGRLFLPVKVEDWDAKVVQAIGADGRLYRIPSGRATRLADRADLARRAGVRRGRLAPDDLGGRLALAQWCAELHIRRHARELVAEVLAARPNDATARALRERLGGE